MLLRLYFLMFGFGLSLIGFIYIISYLNLLTVGYNFTEYVKFIISRYECWNAVFGLIIIIITIYIGGKNELHI